MHMQSETIQAAEAVVPYDLEAERATLSSLVIGDAVIRAIIRSTIDGGDFFLAQNKVIWDIAVRMIDADRPLDMLSVRAELERLGLLTEIGGTEELGMILYSMPTAIHGRHYAEIVRERSMRRKLIELGNDILRRAYTPSRLPEADEIAQVMLEKISKLATAGRSSDYWQMSDLMCEVMEQLEAGGTPLVLSGIKPLDEITGGIGIGEMCILAARPSMGKSTVLRQIALHAARTGVPIGFISLEEGGMKIARNILASECQIPNNRIRKGNLGEEEWNALTIGAGNVGSLPIYCTDKARRIQDIRAVATVWAAKHGVKMIILDYLQRVRGTSGDTEYARVSRVSGELSDLWKEIGVAAVVAAQLNRGVESREDKRPNMSDLRDSGQIEQDADGIVFLHREDYYHLDDLDYQPTHVAEFIIAKWRDGVRGKVVKMKSDLTHQRFTEMPEPQYADPFAN